ncbi:tetratricopeptide repeat protein [Novosphingobium sp.]|uniref:tetratricopeptide repeat protein n=1 Tax=Novosphingobium sp. TaxID=1874826 RepID=UPI002737325E|nr:tetratricopeptide repeat protein [Novosphingobium sp.]MDP3908157.1 tetratricopeptide repeat protein [Novosphingobium sp.]
MALPPATPANPTKPTSDRDAAQQDVFLREVDEALREQQMVDIAKRYGIIIGGGITLLLVGLGGYLFWDHSVKQSAGEVSERTTLVLDRLASGPTSAGAALGDLAALKTEGSAGARANAAMLHAAALVQTGKTDEAAREFAAIAANADAPQPLRDLAAIRELSIRFDAVPPSQVVDRLKPLAVPGNPWFGSAGELVGMAYLKQGKPELAGPLFAAIGKDKEVPQSLASRMRQLAGQLGYESGDAAADVAPAQN